MEYQHDKVVLVTGAGSGIGRAIALELASQGARVVLAGRNPADLTRIEAEILEAGGTAVSIRTDVARREDVTNAVAFAVARFGRLDVFVANAGIAPISPLADLRVDDWDAMVDINVKGALHAVAAALPVFLAQNSGHFIFTVSTAGITISPTMVVYAASKNAVRTLAEGLRVESQGRYRVTAVSPGFVATNLASSMPDEAVRQTIETTMGEIALEPVDVARAISFAIAQPNHVDIGDIVIRPAVQG